MTALQPALIIGLGGSGIEIIRRFRRRLHADYPGATHVRFLGIDTDPQSPNQPETPRLPADEFFHAGNFQMSQYVGTSNIDNFPAIRAWWKAYDRLPLAFVATGAGQRRPVGRLALFVHFNDIKAALTRQLQAIFNASSFANLPPEYRKQITVYVVASTCGGTGTGMFLDVAYMARQLIPEVMPQVIPKVRSLLMMPSAFTGTGKVPSNVHQSLKSNAYGALTELDWCMSKTVVRGPVEYPTQQGPWNVTRELLAFDSCFLVGNQDAQGAFHSRWADLVERGSAHLQLTLASAITQQGNSALDNVESWMGALNPAKGRAQVYSSMNADEILLPIARVYARWTRMQAQQLCTRLEEPARPGTQGAADITLKRLSNGTGLGRLLGFSLRDDIKKYLPSLSEWEAAARQADPDRPDAELLIQNADTLQQQAARSIERARLNEVVEAAANEAAQEITDAVGQVIGRGSVEDARLFLERVTGTLDSLLEHAAGERRRLPANWTAEFASRLRGVKKGLLQKKEGFAAALSEEASSALGKAPLTWEHALWTQLDATLRDSDGVPRLKAQIENQLRRLRQLGANLHTANLTIQSLADPVIPSGMLAALTDEQIDAGFADPARQERLAAFMEAEIAPILNDANSSPEALAAVIREISRRNVKQVADDFVAEVQIGPEDIAHRLDRLQPMAVPSANWDALISGNVAARPQRIALIGLPASQATKEENDHRIRDMLQVSNKETTVVSIAETDRVLMLVQHHGYPLFALAEVTDCRQAFIADASGQELRLTLPEVEARRWDIEPSTAQASNQWFAVALAVGRLRADRIGGGYEYLGGPAKDEPISLAKGESGAESARTRARDEFLIQGLSDEFKKALRLDFAADGTLYAALQTWLTTESARATDPAYPRTFRKDIEEVRQYASNIQFT